MKAMINHPAFAFFKTFQPSGRSTLVGPVGSTIRRFGKWRGICVALGLALAQPASAQIIYQTDFSGGAGTLPASWTSRVSATGAIALNGAGQLVYSTTDSGVGMAYWTGNSGAIQNGVITNAKVTSLLQWPSQNNGQSIGILGRVQDTSLLSMSGYFVGLYRTGSVNSLIIGKDPVGNNFGSILDQVQVTLTTNTFYLLESTFSGDTISVSLYAAAGGEAIRTLSVTDSSYTSGVFGVRSRSLAADRQFIFDNYTIAAVPEPSSVAMLAGAGALAWGIARRKSRSATRR